MKLLNLPKAIAAAPALLLLIACGGGGGANTSDQPSYLFSQDAERGRLDLSPDGTGTLSLSSASPKTLFFQDRDNRKNGGPQAGTVDTAAFVVEWSNPADADNFAVNPPNAAVEYKFGNGEIRNVAFQLSQPTYNETNATLTYQVSLIEVGAYPALASGVHETFSDVGVFIDNADGTDSPVNYTLNIPGVGNKDAHVCVNGPILTGSDMLDQNNCTTVARFVNDAAPGSFDVSATRVEPGFRDGCDNANPLAVKIVRMLGCIKPRVYDGPGAALIFSGGGSDTYNLCISNGPTPQLGDGESCAQYAHDHDPNIRNGFDSINIIEKGYCNITASAQDLLNVGCTYYPPLYQ